MHPSLATSDGNQPIVVAWVDVSHLTRECMTRAIAGAQSRFVIIPFESAYDCIKASGQSFDLVVFYSHEALPHKNGDLAALREAFSSARLVILCDDSELAPSAVKDLLNKGVAGLVLASQTGIQMLVSALGLVAAGGIFVPKQCVLSQNSAEQASVKHGKARSFFTSREIEVLQLLKEGKANKIIAYELHLSEATVKVHVRNTMRKTGSTNRTQVAMNANRFLEAAA
jgi:DNA-binding NarL/FixJ family response regulator